MKREERFALFSFFENLIEIVTIYGDFRRLSEKKRQKESPPKKKIFGFLGKNLSAVALALGTLSVLSRRAIFFKCRENLVNQEARISIF